MKHATRQTLAELEPLLAKVRRHSELREKSPGAFYLKSKAVLHFHEDPAGLFADLRTAAEWERFPVNTHKERAAILQALARFLSA